MKKIIALILVLIGTTLPIYAYDFESDGFYYSIEGWDEVFLTSNPDDPYSGTVIVPKEVEFNGNKFYVTGISEAFTNCKNLDKVTVHGNIKTVCGFSSSSVKEVVLEDGIEQIGGFDYCTNLLSISLPPSVKIVQSCAFSYSGLETIEINSDITWRTSVFYESHIKTIDLSASKMTYLPSSIFYNCCDLESVILSDTMTEIREEAFKDCVSLKSIVLPTSLVKIGKSAFHSCSLLESIDFPDSLTEIGESAFYSCSLLKSIDFPDSLTKIGKSAFHSCSLLKSIDFPDSLTEIGGSAFQNCYSLESIGLPKSLTVLSENVFNNCTSLKSIELPETLARIEFMAFYNTGLKSIRIPKSVTFISDPAFASCTQLESLEFEDGCTFAGGFRNCPKLTTVTLPESIVEIGSFAYTNIEKIHIGSNVEIIHRYYIEKPNNKIDPGAFAGCKALKEVTFAENHKLEELGGFEDCLLLEKVDLTPLKALTSIGYKCFSGCKFLKELTFPKNLKWIADYALMDCNSLEILDFPEGVMQSDDRGPYGHCPIVTNARKLKTLVCPVRCFSSYYSWAANFTESTKLEEIIVKILDPKDSDLEYISFSKLTYADATLKVPVGTADLYRECEGWKNFLNIVEDPTIEGKLSDVESIHFYNHALMQFTGDKIIIGSDKNVSLCIYNTSGVLVRRCNNVNGDIDISDLQPDIYIVQISNEGSVTTHKIAVE